MTKWNVIQLSDNLDLILVITAMLIFKTQQNEMLESKAQSGKVLMLVMMLSYDVASSHGNDGVGL